MTQPASTTSPSITADMTMAEILRRAPAAQRALFQRYHVGGCSSCGFEPSDTLADVCRSRNLLDVNEVIGTILLAHEVDQRMLLEPAEAKRLLDQRQVRIIDVRSPEEWAAARVQGTEPLDYANAASYMELPKDTPLVFLCRTGEDAGRSSKDVASYFIGHGFSKVHAVRGGLNAWRAELDPTIPDYDIEPSGVLD